MQGSTPYKTSLVPPLVARRDVLEHVPMLDDLAVLHPIQVVEGGMLAGKLPLRERQDEVGLADNPMWKPASPA
jgi:hypothetical protein